jgi:16S rRNA (cytidine1402-2'-O)-methyltransferase
MPPDPDAPDGPAPPVQGGRLVVVATPIGNLGDLSPRAAEALRSADVVAAEDTRRTRVLLDHIGAGTAMTSYHEHNESARTGPLLDRVAAGETVVLVSDAGTPGVADPGYRLVRAAIDRGLPVDAVPGPSAVIQALVLSGLALDRFTFEGFLPRKGGARQRRLEELVREHRTMIFYVAPHRAADDLEAMAGVFGDRPAALARELTKLHEEVYRAPLDELARRVAAEGVRGEVTLVVGGAAESEEMPGAASLAARVHEVVAAGSSKKDAIAAVAGATGVARRVVYQAVIDEAAVDRGTRSDDAAEL